MDEGRTLRALFTEGPMRILASYPHFLCCSEKANGCILDIYIKVKSLTYRSSHICLTRFQAITGLSVRLLLEVEILAVILLIMGYDALTRLTWPSQGCHPLTPVSKKAARYGERV